MIQIRPAAQRGKTSIDWLESRHTFSFGDYYDPDHLSFGVLRVINEDWVQGGRGFETHGHRDMEIITYVVEGQLAHRDSLGHASTIVPGEIQWMTAGTGIQHSEKNPSAHDPVHLLQIWIEPNQRGLTPGYDQRALIDKERFNQWQPLIRPDGAEGTMIIHQDVSLAMAYLMPQQTIEYPVAENRRYWLQIVCGELMLNDQYQLQDGDGAGLLNESQLRLTAQQPAEILLFDLPV